ncbi:MAG: hypothetical protein SGI91_00305 [Alphaproteobacteria bacterium]|nr:hypothetical protein [Alphaproteobacteria bacterium]
MKRILILGCVAIFPFFGSQSLAAGTGDATVSTTLGQTCAFTSAPPSIVAINPTPGETNIGRLGYTCNFVGSASLVLQLPDGTNLRNGSNTVLYDVFWGIPPNPLTPGAYQNWPFPANLAFSWNTAGTANNEIGGDFYIRLNTAPTIAGTYTSVISYTLSP